MKLRILLIVLVIFLSLFLGVRNAYACPGGNCSTPTKVSLPSDTPVIPTDTPFVPTEPATETVVFTDTPNPTPTTTDVLPGTSTPFKIEITPTQELPERGQGVTPTELPNTGIIDDLFSNYGGIMGWILVGVICIGVFVSFRLIRKKGL